ncbi:hypothetical protein M0R45_035630 [Rubus argutus]|uniref:Uncharacterized protein n=1 Tax=Rubus argutus TaxID=59490 RepID=A0AAW1VXY4_RUBAR
MKVVSCCQAYSRLHRPNRMRRQPSVSHGRPQIYPKIFTTCGPTDDPKCNEIKMWMDVASGLMSSAGKKASNKLEVKDEPKVTKVEGKNPYAKYMISNFLSL